MPDGPNLPDLAAARAAAGAAGLPAPRATTTQCTVNGARRMNCAISASNRVPSAVTIW